MKTEEDEAFEELERKQAEGWRKRQIANKAEPCDMGQMCLNCQPRGPNGECPDKEQIKLSCGVDYADGLLTVSVVRRHADGVMEVIHCEQIAMPSPCPQCERFKESAANWRRKAYELGGTPLPSEPSDSKYRSGWNAALEMAAFQLQNEFRRAFGEDTLASIAVYIKGMKK